MLFFLYQAMILGSNGQHAEHTASFPGKAKNGKCPGEVRSQSFHGAGLQSILWQQGRREAMVC